MTISRISQVALNLNESPIENNLNKILKLFCMYLLMYLLDLHHFWIFEIVLKEVINKICKLMCSIFL